MRLYNRTLQKLLDKWPGKKYLGIYRFLPIFFVLGAALEFSMINWHVGEVNFCT
ncbi:Small integral membrane protein 4 [Cryptotermes secundus]|uniref:Small integral membrane protein 4 n=1 Tax=Cryptotermes secundus TaxID=105785 RepID=A0A2J7R0U3_9NEOP|nr:Small integral membrane protein 4 [Cryptotermes secundus]